RMDAPDNESLRAIEQLQDHSELSSMYPHAHDQWEGTELMSPEERERKRALEQLNISLSIRRWFFLVGFLIPIPVVLAALMSVTGVTYVNEGNIGFMLLPIVISLGIWVLLSNLAMKKVDDIFYGHSIAITPYLMAHVGLLLLAMQVTYVAASSFYSNSLIINTAITSGFALVVSVMLSGVLLVIWTTPHLVTKLKFASIAVIAL